MKLIWKRIRVLVLALALVLGVLPGLAGASEAPPYDMDDGLTHMNIFGAGTDLIGRAYPFARYDSRIQDLLDESGRPDYAGMEEDIRYRKAGVMFQAASLEGTREREYFFSGGGAYQIVFYSTKRLLTDNLTWSSTDAPLVNDRFTERVIGEGEYALFSYVNFVSVPETDASATLYYGGTPAASLTLRQISETGVFVTNMLVSSYREQEPGVFSELTLELYGFNLPMDAAAYALREEHLSNEQGEIVEDGQLLAAASAVQQEEIAFTCQRVTVTFSFENGIDHGALNVWPELYINDALSFYYAPPEQRGDWRYNYYDFVQLPNCYSGRLATGLQAVNLTNAAATDINMSPEFTGAFLDYPPLTQVREYWGMGQALFPAEKDWQYQYSGMEAPAYWLAATGDASIHELYLYGEAELDPALLQLYGVEVAEPFMVSVFGDGGGELYTYRAAIRVPEAGGTLGLSYCDSPLFDLPLYRVADLDKARIPTDYEWAQWEPATEWEDYPAPLVCTCWAADFTLGADGGMRSFDLALSGFNLPTDPAAYDLFSYEAADAGETFVRAEAVRVDDYGKTIVTFSVENPKYLRGATYPILCDVVARNHYPGNMNFFTSYSNMGGPGLTGRTVAPGGDGLWHITRDLRDYGMFCGCALRLFSPWNVLGKDYDAMFSKPVDFAWNEGETDAVSVTAYVTSSDLQRNADLAPEEQITVTVLLALYDEAGRLIGVTTQEITAPQTVKLSLSDEDADSAALFCWVQGDALTPLKEKVSSQLHDTGP